MPFLCNLPLEGSNSQENFALTILGQKLLELGNRGISGRLSKIGAFDNLVK